MGRVYGIVTIIRDYVLWMSEHRRGARAIVSMQTWKWGLVLLSLAVGIAQGVYLLDGFERFRTASENAIAFENKRGEIARLDEVLTMSARLHAATGDPVWRDRYLDHVPPLDQLLEEALALAANDDAQLAMDQVTHSNAALVAIEDKSLLLTADGRLSEALDLMTSPGYEQLKISYRQGLTQALEISRDVLRNKVDSNRDRLLVAAFVLVVSLFCLSELWRRLSVLEQRRAAEQIKASLDREQHSSSLQRQFVSMLSHELRTPLAIIDGNARRLRRRAGDFPDDKIRAVGEKISEAVSHLTELMEGILNVSKIEEGRIDVAKETFDLAALIEKVVTGFREVEDDRRIDLKLSRLPKVTEGDPRLLTQVVSNLVSNALKYSGRESLVRIEGYLEGQDVVVAVHDEGVGIPGDEIAKLGQRFFRASSSVGITGTGIGLHFIKHLIDLHDGRMDVDSTEGVGSSFFVRLPQNPTTRHAPEAGRSDNRAPALSPALPVH